MNKTIFKKLCLNYDKEPDKDLYELWEYQLRAYDEEEIQQMVEYIITNDRFFPTLSRVLEVIKEISKKELDTFDSEKNVREKMKRLNIKPSWLDQEIVNEPIDEETQETFEDFNSFLMEFRNE